MDSCTRINQSILISHFLPLVFPIKKLRAIRLPHIFNNIHPCHHQQEPSAFPLWKNVYLVLLPIFNWVVCCFFDVELYELFICMLDINLLSVTSFANSFSHPVGCLFVLLMASFAVQKLLSLIRSHLFIFAFIYFRR